MNKASEPDFQEDEIVDDSLVEEAIMPIEEPQEPNQPGIIGVDIEVKSGQTLSGLLQEQGVAYSEVANAVSAVRKVFDVRKLRAGQNISLELEDAKFEALLEGEEQPKEQIRHLRSMRFQPSITEIVDLRLDAQQEFVAKLEEVDLDKVFLHATGEIESSFYESMINAGVTDNITLQLISALSFVVDFQRDIKTGNEFEVLYEAYAKDNEIIKGRMPKYVKLKLSREEIEIFVTENENGTYGYHHANGHNVRKALLRTPINGARISSRYGNRKHPILGYTRLHAGVDFAAPTGTPIYAAGDGKIAFKGRKGGYGNYIKIRHNGTYDTAYAHLSRFAKNMRNGVRVKQGQVIGYVGSTGRSTGPHLHYEVIKNGKPINPQNAKFNIVSKLTGTSLANFKIKRDKTLERLKTSPSRSEYESAKSEALSQEN